MLRKNSLLLGLLASLSFVVGCEEPADSDAKPRAGVQIIGRTIDLASVDMCWRTNEGETRVPLEEQMVDDASTRIFDLPVEPGLRVSFVAPGNDCTAAPIASFTVDSVPAERGEGLALLVSGTAESGVEGTLVPVVPEAEGVVSLRNGCTAGEATASRSTRTGSDGSCYTRATLFECIRTYHDVGGGNGFWSNSLEQTYDSGWLDCRAAVCDELAP